MPEPLAPAIRRACLTILVPASSEDHVVDWLMAYPEFPIEFSVHEVAMRGPSVHLSTGVEKVGGFARRSEVRLMVECARLEALVAALHSLPDGVAGTYWVVPVTHCGTLGGLK
jgi:hypothetical protein